MRGAPLVAALLFAASRASAQVAAPEPPAPVAPETPPPGVPPGGHWVFVTTDPAKPGAPAAKPAGANLAMLHPVFEHDTTWDLNIDGAYGRYFGDRDAWTGFVRARAGVLFIRAPYFNAVGVTYEYSSLSNATFGIQAELLNLEYGVWAQVGGLLDVSGHPGAMAAVGYSLLGLEAQVRSYDGHDDEHGTGVALYAKLRIPVSIIAQIFRPKPPPN